MFFQVSSSSPHSNYISEQAGKALSQALLDGVYGCATEWHPLGFVNDPKEHAERLFCSHTGVSRSHSHLFEELDAMHVT